MHTPCGRSRTCSLKGQKLGYQKIEEKQLAEVSRPSDELDIGVATNESDGIRIFI
jgi:hypothetical protein